jgi:uncharacterized protein (TIGR02265 family)
MGTSSGGWSVDAATWEVREELERRVELATPGDTVRGLFFLGALELVRALEGEERVVDCLVAGGEPRFVEFFNYPVSAYLRMNERAARVLAPRLGSWEEAQRQLGRRATEDLLKSAAGKALMLVARGETRRLVAHLPSAYRAVVSYGERSLVWEGPTRGRLVMRRDFLPCEYHEGVLEAALERMKARAVEVRGLRTGVLEGEYLLSWT